MSGLLVPSLDRLLSASKQFSTETRVNLFFFNGLNNPLEHPRVFLYMNPDPPWLADCSPNVLLNFSDTGKHLSMKIFSKELQKKKSPFYADSQSINTYDDKERDIW